jgi:hypothetical protein
VLAEKETVFAKSKCHTTKLAMITHRPDDEGSKNL